MIKIFNDKNELNTKIMKLLMTSLLITISLHALQAQDNKAELVKGLISDVIKVEPGDLNEQSPISSINKLVFAQAEKTISLTKENIEKSIQEAKSYKSCIITVGIHTIVLVSDINNTTFSGSWDCRMPYGKGYVQKGAMNFKEDYINNIIGVPDSQRRMMFLFN